MTGTFHDVWKKPTFFQYTKREQTNQEELSLLNYCGKIFVKVIFHAVYANNQLLTLNQYAVRQIDSAVNHLLYITHRIYAAFEEFIM